MCNIGFTRACLVTALCICATARSPVELTTKTFDSSNNVDFETDVAQNHIPRHQFLNPVLQNQSQLVDWLEQNEKTNVHYANHARKKRSCTGQLCRRSLCPWRQEWDTQNTRTPMNIMFAVCNSRHCTFDFQGVNYRTERRLKIQTECDIVKTDILIIKNGTKEWLTGWPIACICVEKRHDMIVGTLGTANIQSVAAASKSFGNTQTLNTDTEPDASINSVDRQQAFLRELNLTTTKQKKRRRKQKNKVHSETWEQLMTRRIHGN